MFSKNMVEGLGSRMGILVEVGSNFGIANTVLVNRLKL